MKKLLVSICLFLLLSVGAHSAGSSSSDSLTTVKKTNYEKAVSYIDKAKKFEEDGKQKKAEKQYEKAQKLLIKSKQNGINEYLGELYVVTNRMDLAKERLEVLRNCNCEEFQELKEIIDGTRKSKY